MYILVCISIVMSSNKFFDELDYDNELKACNISRPYDALKSDFAKKILNNLSKKTKSPSYEKIFQIYVSLF